MSKGQGVQGAIRIGDGVRVRVYGGEVVDRVVYDIRGDSRGLIYDITTPQEWMLARGEDREPLCVGFRAGYVVESIGHFLWTNEGC